jgi:UDP:flavonoid glycosyltransferase YjiC (YdhE family)
MRLTGFPLYDEKDLAPMPASLLKFLDDGPPPIAFTPGSAMWQGRAFFDAAVATAQQLGRRGLLLTRHRDHLPPTLPPGILHVDYAPFSQLLPRCCAIVHHGGMGTSAQSMSAGVPQLVTPMAHDQLDNAVRMERLGVARWLLVKKFKARPAASLLEDLLESPKVAEFCRAVRRKFQAASPLEDACNLLESLAPNRERPTPQPAAVAT